MGDIDGDGVRRMRGEGADGIGPFIGGIAIGALLVGLVWAFIAAATSGPSGTRSGQTVGADLGGPLAGLSQGTSPSRLDRCLDAVDKLARPMRQAQPALDQWAVHVGAMNKLVVGAITLPQATAFWNQTRVGAHHHIRAFDRAMAQVEQDGVDCPTPDRLGAKASATLRACSTQATAETRTLAAARTAIETWRHHVQAMEQLRTGRLSPAAATRMWLTMWQRGVEEIKAYRAAARAERHAPWCAGVGSTSSTPSPAGSATPAAPMSSTGSMDMP